MTDPGTSYLLEQITKLSIYLNRWVVQRQFLFVLLAFLCAWLIKTYFWKYARQQEDKVRAFSKRAWFQFALHIVEDTVNPLIIFISLNWIRRFFLFQQWNNGLIIFALKTSGIYLFYSLIIAFANELTSAQVVKFYQNRLFLPLLFTYFITSFLSLVTDLSLVVNVSLFKLFDSDITIGSLLLITFGLYIWFTLVALLEYIISHTVLRYFYEDIGPRQATAILIRYFLITLGVVVIISSIGLNSTVFAAMTGGLSLGVGFGLKEVISNFISGIVLLFEGNLRPGDVISVEGELSQVKVLGVRAAVVEVVKDNSEKIIPNQIFFTESMTTHTRSNPLIYRSLFVSAHYSCDPSHVINTLLDTAEQHPQILKDPCPIAFFVCFGESSLDFELKFWLNNPLIGKRVTSELACMVWKAFDRENIPIPYPQRDVHIYPTASTESDPTQGDLPQGDL